MLCDVFVLCVNLIVTSSQKLQACLCDVFVRCFCAMFLCDVDVRLSVFCAMFCAMFLCGVLCGVLCDVFVRCFDIIVFNVWRYRVAIYS